MKEVFVSFMFVEQFGTRFADAVVQIDVRECESKSSPGVHLIELLRERISIDLELSNPIIILNFQIFNCF